MQSTALESDHDCLASSEGGGKCRSVAQWSAAGVTRIDGAYDKVLWWLHDPRFPLRLLPPYQAAEPSAAEAFLRYLRQELPHWAP